MKKYTIQELNELYLNSEQEDKEVYSEMRSNIQLVAGDHYSKRSLDKYFNRVRTNNLPEANKLRLTKNHIAKIVHHYEESILAQAPGVKIVPQVDSELQDQKDAELNEAVWSYVKYKHKLRDKFRLLVQDFVGVGEVAVKIFWDPNKGDLLGYAQKMDEVGNPLADELGQPVMDETSPIFSGDIEFERVFGFNIFRTPGAKDMDDSEMIGIRKMVDIKSLKEIYKDDEEKLKWIQEASREEFVIFDSQRNAYSKSKDQVLLKEYYFKPCIKYPEGYFYIATESGILEEGPLPFGIFPLIWRGFDTVPTRPRGYSIIKRARPYQAELNRAASQQATHQITLADDKVIYQAGTKLSPGALLPGVRGITYQGQAPTILPGRAGEQFTSYIAATIDELYQVVELQELTEENPASAQTDPWANLYKSFKQRMKFAKYGSVFESFLIEFCEKTLMVLKNYLPEDTFIQMVGRKEIVNIPEFKKTIALSYQIKVEPASDDLDTQMGKQLQINQIMQYIGKQLSNEAIGKMLREMPFSNFDVSFDEFTLDYDNFKNDCLALERGEPVMFAQSDNHDYYVKMLNARMKKPDFKYLDPMIQQNYAQKLQMHEQGLADQNEKLMAAKKEMIPTTGPMVGVDLYVENKDDPTKAPKRARLPSAAVEWLVQTMEAQGQSLDKLEKLDKSNLANIASMLLSSQQAQGNVQGGMNGSNTGNINPVPGAGGT